MLALKDTDRTDPPRWHNAWRAFAIALLFGAFGPTAAFAVQETNAPAAQQKEAPMPSPATKTEHAHTNRLVDETSPYLLQHAHNPVDWYPWGEEALSAAKEQDKPIFLSIGYSSCHWCHVMERESFENEEVAAILNEHFISIKVDREERPDLDEIYMTAVQLMTGHGGWPMSVWLTPGLKPFYGGTYFPPDDRPGYPAGFKRLLTALANAWEEKRSEVEQQAERLAAGMTNVLSSVEPPEGALSPEIIQGAVTALRTSYDREDGGFGEAPKFPSSPSIAVLLREYARSGDTSALQMATHTLDKMAMGGMYDHIGGGFHRYSVDGQWLVPHFEKMLYDNGQLAQVYLEAYQVTKDPFYRKVVDEILEYVLRDMTDELGGFHSAEDADSEGEEGKFYIWSHDEVLEVLGEEDAKVFNAYYNVSPQGNFSSHETYHANLNIPHLTDRPEKLAEKLGMAPEELASKIEKFKAVMLERRSKRVRPGLDDKVLTSWNSLMISAFAQAHQVFGTDKYRQAAENAGGFVVEHMIQDDVLLRTHRKGESRLRAYLDDYAFAIMAFVDLYETTFDDRWIETADWLAQRMNEQFWDDTAGNYFYTGAAHKNLIIRTRPTYDGAEPSGNSMAAYGLLRLAKLLDKPEYHEKAQRVLESNHGDMKKNPQAYLKMICALDFLLYPPKEIAIAGAPENGGTQELLDAVRTSFVPNKVVALIDPRRPDVKELEKRMPLLASKAPINGDAAAYVCKNFACERPVTEPAALLNLLGISTED